MSKIIYSFLSLLFLSLLMNCSQEPSGQGVVSSPDGVEIHYTVKGSGKTTLVLIHCWSCDQTYWDNQVDLLAQNYRVITPDLGGHGKSGTNRSNWTLESFANDVIAVLDKLNIKDNIILAGHSMGGFVVLNTAVKLGSRVKGIILVDSFSNIWWPLPDSVLIPILAGYNENFKNFTYNYVKNALFPPDADSVIADRIATDMSLGPAEVGIGAIESMLTGNYDQLLKEIGDLNIPVWLINAEMFPTDYHVMDSLGFQVVTMPGVGHFLMIEKPEVFNDLFTKTLGEIDRSTN